MLLKFLTFKEIYFFPVKIRRENYVPKKLKEKNAKKLSKSSSYVSIVSWCQMNPPPIVLVFLYVLVGCIFTSFYSFTTQKSAKNIPK